MHIHRPLRFTTAAVAVAFICAAVAAMPGAVSARATGFTAHFRTIKIHGTHQLFVYGVNDQGVLLGNFLTKTSGYEYIKRGKHLTRFNYGSSSFSFPGTINDRGVAVGFFADATGTAHGWIRFRDGKFRRINDPRAAAGPGLGTIVNAINDSGVIVGYYEDAGNNSHGFIDDHGKFRTVNAPGARGGSGFGTNLTGINDAGEIVGFYFDKSGVARGFTYKSGKFSKFSAPGAGTALAEGTFTAGISRNGTIDGTITSPRKRALGFIRIGGRFFRLNDPHASKTSGMGTNVLGIDENGDAACGVYNDKTGAAHGWVATLSGLS